MYTTFLLYYSFSKFSKFDQSKSPLLQQLASVSLLKEKSKIFPKLIELLSWNGPTVHVCCFMLARAYPLKHSLAASIFVSRVKKQRKIFVSRKFRQQGHSLAEVSLYKVQAHTFLCTALREQRLSCVWPQATTDFPVQGLRQAQTCAWPQIITDFLCVALGEHRLSCVWPWVSTYFLCVVLREQRLSCAWPQASTDISVQDHR